MDRGFEVLGRARCCDHACWQQDRHCGKQSKCQEGAEGGCEEFGAVGEGDVPGNLRSDEPECQQ